MVISTAIEPGSPVQGARVNPVSLRLSTVGNSRLRPRFFLFFLAQAPVRFVDNITARTLNREENNNSFLATTTS
jgi:hypothetical protein